jgi:hypothetical protein
MLTFRIYSGTEQKKKKQTNSTHAAGSTSAAYDVGDRC